MGKRIYARTGALAPVLLAALGILGAVLAVRLNLGVAQAAPPSPSPTPLSDPASDLLPSIEPRPEARAGLELVVNAYDPHPNERANELFADAIWQAFYGTDER